MAYKFRLATVKLYPKVYYAQDERVSAIAKYRAKFREDGIEHRFMNTNHLNICIRFETEEDCNFVMLTHPGEFMVYDESKLNGQPRSINYDMEVWNQWVRNGKAASVIANQIMSVQPIGPQPIYGDLIGDILFKK